MRLPSRDVLSVGLAGATFLLISTNQGVALEWLYLGPLAGVLVAAGLPWLFGEQWRTASVPLASAVAVALMCAAIRYDPPAVLVAASTILPVVGALPLAAHLAQLHRNPDVARWLGFWSAAAALGVVLITANDVLGGGYGVASAILPLMAMVSLIPGVGVAFGARRGAGESATTSADRMATVVIGATPGVAMTVIGLYGNPLLFLGWLAAVVAWRRFTITPLLRVTQRTQQERDLTVSAIEAERARIAADLHDDALQELTALVRRLDVAGDQEGAELARGVAERLRAICSDLRLPLLDDLGAGAALEWLVARVQPMAAGQVRLERVDSQRPPSGVELAVFRVAQEALANAVKHGKPPITIRYRVDDSGRVSLSVDDQGSGIPPTAAESAVAAGHLGLANMQQRAEQIGGLLDVRRWPSGGTHVALEWRPQ